MFKQCLTPLSIIFVLVVSIFTLSCSESVECPIETEKIDQILETLQNESQNSLEEEPEKSNTPPRFEFNPEVGIDPDIIPEGVTLLKDDDILVIEFSDIYDLLQRQFTIFVDAEQAFNAEFVIKKFKDIENFIEEYCRTKRGDLESPELVVAFTSRAERDKFAAGIPHPDARFWVVTDPVYIVPHWNEAYFPYWLHADSFLACDYFNNIAFENAFGNDEE